jgi:hypothetical protein
MCAVPLASATQLIPPTSSAITVAGALQSGGNATGLRFVRLLADNAGADLTAVVPGGRTVGTFGSPAVRTESLRITAEFAAPRQFGRFEVVLP